MCACYACETRSASASTAVINDYFAGLLLEGFQSHNAALYTVK